MKRILTFTTIIVALLLVFFALTDFKLAQPNAPVTLFETTAPPIPTLNPDSIALGKQLYTQYCSSCHGQNLEGVSNWKVIQPDGSYLPPPHDSSGHTWHHPDPVLIEIVAKGGDPTLYNTKMPGFGDRLTETEIMAVLDYIKSQWGQEEREYQWWMTTKDELP